MRQDMPKLPAARMPVDRHWHRSDQRARGAEREERGLVTQHDRDPVAVLDPSSAERGGDPGGLCRQLIVRDLTLTEPHHHGGRSIACMIASLNPAPEEAQFCSRCGRPADMALREAFTRALRPTRD